jgi:hypothetical protein
LSSVNGFFVPAPTTRDLCHKGNVGEVDDDEEEDDNFSDFVSSFESELMEIRHQPTFKLLLWKPRRSIVDKM